jgi:ribosome biogenesis GTPase
LDIYPRKNELVRPTVANVDCGVIVMSAIEPDFSSYLVDRFLVYLEANNISPIIYVTKIDLLDDKAKADMLQYKTYYEAIGYTMILSDYPDTSSLDELVQTMGKGMAVFMGQSGAGKSTLLNQLMPELDLLTGEISTALGRGRHTTRHVELHPVGEALIADTPGFSTIDLIDIEAVDLPSFFPDFEALRDQCRFAGCMHINEPNCRVKEAVASGEVAPYRYEHYLQFHEEIVGRKPMYIKKNKR